MSLRKKNNGSSKEEKINNKNITNKLASEETTFDEAVVLSPTVVSSTDGIQTEVPSVNEGDEMNPSETSTNKVINPLSSDLEEAGLPKKKEEISGTPKVDNKNSEK